MNVYSRIAKKKLGGMTTDREKIMGVIKTKKKNRFHI